MLWKRPETDSDTDSFLYSDELKNFYRTHNHHTLAEIHTSFNNLDCISIWIRKEQLLQYPDGRGLEGEIKTVFKVG